MAQQPPMVDRRRGTPPTGLDRGRSSGLDGLRALAALLVAAFHLHTVNGVSFGPLDPIVGGGDTGVYVFFALSGYLLYKPFLQRGRVDLAAYGLKRAGRILPGYFVALAGLAFVTGSQLPVQHPLPYLTMSASYDIPLRGFLGNAWTLSAEILFYLSLPLVARVARGRELFVLGGIAAASMTLAVIQRIELNEANAWTAGAFPFVAYAFVPGMVLAVVEARRPNVLRSLDRSALLALGGSSIVLGTLTSVLPLALATGIGTALVMGWLLQHRLPYPRALAFIGGASYALYLWHKDLLIAFGPIGLAIAVPVAAASWVFVERPILARIHALTARATEPNIAVPEPALPSP